MKKSLLIIVVLVSAFGFYACEKDKGILPIINFKTGIGYTSADATVARNTSVIIGIDAAKSEGKDVLKTFDVSRVFDGGTSSSFYSEALSGSAGDNYSKDILITTRNVAGTEKYTCTVVNRDGLVNSVTLTITTP